MKLLLSLLAALSLCAAPAFAQELNPTPGPVTSCSSELGCQRLLVKRNGVWMYAAAASGIVNTTTAVTIKAATTGKRNYVSGCSIGHDTLGAATELVIRDGAAGTVLFRRKLQTTAVEAAPVNFETPLQGTAATLLEVATLTAVTGGVYVNCQGYTD